MKIILLFVAIITISFNAIAQSTEKDSDGDGIVDSKDQCPTEKGVAKYNGCPVPDSDDDGINDDDDDCPTVSGLAKYKGCPNADADGDKINDEDDECPGVPGYARFNGCPTRDSDHDGVNDDDDSCTSVAGPASNKGCPEKAVPSAEAVRSVEQAAAQLFFEPNSARLKSTSSPALNTIAGLLKKRSDLLLMIEGYADNFRTEALNKKFAGDRANAVKTYLINKGISTDRLKATGFGYSKSTTNKIPVSNRKNSRVEMHLAIK